MRQCEDYYEHDGTGNRALLRHGETGAENMTYYEYDAVARQAVSMAGALGA